MHEEERGCIKEVGDEEALNITYRYILSYKLSVVLAF